jgi:hypothetical protein
MRMWGVRAATVNARDGVSAALSSQIQNMPSVIKSRMRSRKENREYRTIIKQCNVRVGTWPAVDNNLISRSGRNNPWWNGPAFPTPAIIVVGVPIATNLSGG